MLMKNNAWQADAGPRLLGLRFNIRMENAMTLDVS